MKKYEAKTRIHFPAYEVVQLLYTPEQLEDEARLDGAISAKAQVKKNDGKTIVLVVDREDPSRAPAGKYSKSEKNILTIEWNKETRTNNWKVKVLSMPKMVKVFGTTRVEPDGDGCLLTEKGYIDIKVPIIGNMVAKKLAADLERNFLKKGKLIEEKLKRKSQQHKR